MDSFSVTYQVTVYDGETIDQKIENICLEQSAELPRHLIPDSLKHRIPGTLQQKNPLGDNRYEVTIDWPVDHIGTEITQLLNLLFGNISLKQGIQICGLEWDVLADPLDLGPACGIENLRREYEISYRPLSSSAVKPMGLKAGELAQRVYQMAYGGLDIIKDDHGLADQPYAPFEKRAESCVEAVHQAAMDTGRRSRYFPNITGDHGTVLARYEQAAEMGADGVLISPHLTGLPTLAALAGTDIPLPVIAHPAFSGTLVARPDHGMTPSFLYGELWRALGADLVIFPNTGGRFSFTPDQCQNICEAATGEGPFKRSFPMIGGGIELGELPDWIDTYGNDVVFLIGTSLYQHPEGLRYASRTFSDMVRKNS